MPVNLHSKKRLVSRMYGVGLKRISFDSDHLDDIADAITRENIRSLVTANTIKIRQIIGTSRGRARLKKFQKNKRGTKQGSKKEFWAIYKKICGNTVRNTAHLRTLVEETQAKRKDQK